MDFFASSYSSGTTRPHPHGNRNEHAGQGYGCEANLHLRRASSGLEIDLGSLNAQHHETFSYGKVHKNYDNDIKDKTSEEPLAPQSQSPKSIPGSPSYQYRNTVTSPCLLHHTNTSGGGTVQSPVMPKSYSFTHYEAKTSPHEKTIPEGRELGL